ncbi:hypothetical protein NG798_03755 [Ancylothrix sp. C2]|uniref:hypothetical protein n=1 Tax=Ancylothrix sp. D3o TaxID=2953691 RepID=UPI0021BAD435|nr:hypothetical protein [Ancylothrix sp. D3o]MCT7948892.1 hypothetical protein [Ancylothrix sp. D3o]
MTKSSEQKPAGLSKGIATGLKLWLYFLIGFLVVKYPIRLSILMSLLAGIAGGLINEWWQTEDPDADEDREVAPQKKLIETSQLRTEKQLIKRQRYNAARKSRRRGDKRN